jgi:hypothetical protein
VSNSKDVVRNGLYGSFNGIAYGHTANLHHGKIARGNFSEILVVKLGVLLLRSALCVLSVCSVIVQTHKC